jgi:acyl-CoA reductase-like NAD-dependent aldehyde dehydrogenase
MTQNAELPVAAMLINGRLQQAQGGETFASLNPANGKPVAAIPLGDDRDATLAVDAAAAAFPAWSKLSAAARAKYLHRVADILERRRDEIVLIISNEEGKPLHESQGELQLSIDSLAGMPRRGAPTAPGFPIRCLLAAF